MAITIADSRGALWQWDTGRRVRVDDSSVKQVHYQNRCFGCSVDVDVEDDGTAIIPAELLQDWHPLTAYAYITDDTGAYTVVQQDFIVHKRAKPSGYVYTPTEHAGFDRLRSEIGNLDDLATEDKSTIVAAINEAARSGGGGTKYQIGNGLILDAKTNTLAVDTADAVERDNTKPITSAGVYLEIGNINALLATI